MDFYTSAGKVAIGSRLRQLTEKITDDAAKIYALYKVDLEPKWFPVFQVLLDSPKGITEIARIIGHSHPSVIKIVSEMVARKIVREQKDKNDGRKNIISLTSKGIALGEKLKVQTADVSAAVDSILADTEHDLWEAIGEWEYLLSEKSLLQRVTDQRKKRESSNIAIIDYLPKYAKAFRDLNVEWISKYFKMEKSDYLALDSPRDYILKKGGVIKVALYKGKVAGVCALIKMDDGEYDFELAKMAVSPEAQGNNIGWLLGNAVIEETRARGASKIYLESNTILAPAIKLYQKLGFRKIKGRPTPYTRCNIQMELSL